MNRVGCVIKHYTTTIASRYHQCIKLGKRICSHYPSGIYIDQSYSGKSNWLDKISVNIVLKPVEIIQKFTFQTQCSLPYCSKPSVEICSFNDCMMQFQIKYATKGVMVLKGSFEEIGETVLV